MNRHAEKHWTSVPILYRITLQNAPYMDFNLLVLMTFEVTTVTSMDSQEPACCYNSHLLGFLQLLYKVCFGGAKFDTGLDQLMYESLTLLHSASRRS